MNTNINEQMPDPTPRGEDMQVQRALDDIAWVLRATGSSMLLPSLVHPNLKDAAINAEVALATRHHELVNEVQAIVENPEGFTITSCAEITTAHVVYTKWMDPSEGRSVKELALWELAPAGVLIYG